MNKVLLGKVGEVDISGSKINKLVSAFEELLG